MQSDTKIIKKIHADQRNKKSCKTAIHYILNQFKAMRDKSEVKIDFPLNFPEI